MQMLNLKDTTIERSSTLQVYGIMACNIYWDFDTPGGIQERHKFIISFFPTPGYYTPALIESITAYGPDGYHIDFAKDQVYSARNTNGFIFDTANQNFIYMVNVDGGFIPEGEYTIKVLGKNGELIRRSRRQDNEASHRLVNTYLRRKLELYDSFSPSRLNPLPADSNLSSISCSWNTLKETDDVDAFYMLRLAEAATPESFNTHKLVWWDNMYLDRARGQMDAALNRNTVKIPRSLKPATSYGYFVEIADSNVHEDTNVTIYQPHHFFVTP